MAIRYRVRSLTSSGGDRVGLPLVGVTCIVGGNNAGKSQVLREIARLAHEPLGRQAPLALGEIDVERPDGSIEEAQRWLATRFIEVDTPPGVGRRFTTSVGEPTTSAEEFQGWFGSVHQGSAYLGNAARYFVHHATAGSLAGYAAGVISSTSADTNEPLSRLFSNGELEQTLSDAALATFDQSLTLDRTSAQVRLRVGEALVPVPPINRPTREYADAVARLEPLDVQGDGLRSFVGLALAMLVKRPDVFLVDEPEAFLHPGQARAVGRWLARHAADLDIQLIVATHDRDIILGMLQSESDVAINVVRVSRQGSTTNFYQLEPHQVRQVWDSPVLKYSNVLQGLFHRRVIICESDADCRFFGAAIDGLAAEASVRAIADDTLLVPSGGKSRVGEIAGALSSLGVKARAILDFDVLRVKADLKAIVSGIGHSWTREMDNDYTAFARTVHSAAVDWSVLKSGGLGAVPRGEAHRAVQALTSALSRIGIHIIEVGEMEDFDKDISLHGAGWVSAALERNLHRSEPLRRFVRPLLI